MLQRKGKATTDQGGFYITLWARDSLLHGQESAHPPHLTRAPQGLSGAPPPRWSDSPPGDGSLEAPPFFQALCLPACLFCSGGTMRAEVGALCFSGSYGIFLFPIAHGGKMLTARACQLLALFVLCQGCLGNKSDSSDSGEVDTSSDSDTSEDGGSSLAGCVVTSETDSDADGTADSRSIHTYDQQENLSTYERDSDADGVVDSRTVYTYSDEGYRLTAESDTNADGSPETRTQYTYDTYGNVTLWEKDEGVDGTVDSSEAYVYEYDSEGNILVRERDIGADGSVNERHVYEYDSTGNATVMEHDEQGDGVVDERYTYSYNSNGSMLREDIDGGEGTGYCSFYGESDGVVDEYKTYEYDDNEMVVLWEVYCGDETMEVANRTTYTYDHDGNLVEEVFYDPATEPERRYLYQYNGEGFIVVYEYDDGVDGTVDLRKTYQYEC